MEKIFNARSPVDTEFRRLHQIKIVGEMIEGCTTSRRDSYTKCSLDRAEDFCGIIVDEKNDWVREWEICESL